MARKLPLVPKRGCVKETVIVDQDTIDKLKAGRRVLVVPVPEIIGRHNEIAWAKGPRPAAEIVAIKALAAGHYWHLCLADSLTV